jgi:hypothetical protein
LRGNIDYLRYPLLLFVIDRISAASAAVDNWAAPVRVQQSRAGVSAEVAERAPILVHSFPLMGRYSDSCFRQPQGAPIFSPVGVV